MKRRIYLQSFHLQEVQADSAEEVIDNEEVLARQQELMKKRNKSRLQPEHYNRMHGKPNVMPELERDVSTLREVREMFGRNGTGSGVEPRFMWPSKKEMMLMQEYERVAYPLSLPEMMTKAKEERQDSINLIIARQKEIRSKLEGLHTLKKEIREKIRKQEEDERLEQEKRDQLIEEVRLMYGMRISPQDEKFQEILAEKAEEEKKAQKALKKQMKQQKMIEQMKRLAMTSNDTSEEKSEESADGENTRPQVS